ncbi:glycoside hydrolase family 27 protein [Zasmidium cellare ATCC 36951]|uniref:Alpha-galactosidase n=1 Tax=Zasmidium cellare ATCC 36951 TaxID=1080233 RepID=A0A6A6C5K2_ZASCE|nr:glycoside hydrolase family 27 protein [Zasmidium cellare ATCC 36951]KAF2162457.1 glycoside hydrolase family 27 protein [Zasmidium cellare ATCC 36951]
MIPFQKLSLVLYAQTSLAYHLRDGLGKLPALGWSSWNAFGCSIDARVLATTADLLVSKGFKAAGYEYLNIDDCWGDLAGRNNVTGELQADSQKFPSGIPGVAQYSHSLGLKQGIYSSAGFQTCQGYPASLGHETLDAATFATWEIDYLKYDNCNAPSSWYDTCYSCDQDDYYNPDLVNGTCVDQDGLCPPNYDYGTCKTAERYRRMADALHAQNRTIFYSLCDWGINEPWKWGASMAQSWRTTNDLTVNFTRILNFVNLNTFWQDYNGFYGHNDMDILEVCNGLTPAESRSHFALYAIMKSPLIISTDLASLSDHDTELLQNKYLIAFNQDPTFAAPAVPYKWGLNPDWTFNSTSPAEYWSGESCDGRLIALFNSENTTKAMQLRWGEVPTLRDFHSYNVVDVWTGKEEPCVRTGAKHFVGGHDIAVFLVKSRCT